ncbi:MAG: low affinity iron permease family protein, partial [Actinomycetota bacterium]|nr:low affinity iron permease family protein [Actinomycetota bacterium]
CNSSRGWVMTLSMSSDHPTAPSDVNDDTTWFDRSADRAAQFIARPAFFLISLTLVVLWIVTGPILHFSHHWVDSLVVVTALVTFLIVALLENEGWKGNKATQRKLNAMAAGLAELMAKSDVDQEHVRQLHSAVGLEKRESSSR